MKTLILLLFVFTTPLVVFLSTLLFGGFSNTVFKQELTKSGVYKQIGTYIRDLSFDEQDQMTAQFSSVLKARFTPSYLQTKTENAVDSSAEWISGKSTTPPVISFKEIKEDMVVNHPQVLQQLEQLANEAKQQAASDEWSSEEGQQTVDMMQGLDSISTLAKSDFTIELSTYLAPIKGLYAFMRILLPVLLFLLIVYFILLIILNHSWHSRLKWIGAALMISGTWGFIIIFMNTYLVYLMSTTLLSNATDFVSMFTPILVTFSTYFVHVYMNYQGIVSVASLLAAAGCFGAVAMMHQQSPKIKTSKSK